MPPIIMNDCGSGGVSSGSPGDNKRRVGTGMCDIRKTSYHCYRCVSDGCIHIVCPDFENMNNVSSYNLHQKESILIKRYLNEIKG